MHFCIPDTQELIDGSGNSYLGYNIHINGLFHCTVRYKQLLNLHEQLVKDMDISLPPFPPKKFFPLTINQQEDRRLGLEKYIQTIGQNTKINNSQLLNGFLLNAQQESCDKVLENEDFDVFLMNNSKITLKISTVDNSRRVLKKVCHTIELSEEYHDYFCLFVVVECEEGHINILRKLQDFESPLLTVINIEYPGIKVMLGKGYWDIGNDVRLMEDPVALKLLYIQAVSEVNRGWILVINKLQSRLDDARDQDDRKKYLELVRSLKHYGYIQFASCHCDYPEPGTKVLVSIGRNEMSLLVSLENGEQHEAIFKVTRMRCWRITTLHNGLDDRKDDESNCSLEFSFEYLVARNQLQWITISSQQAILMSICLQSMIDELLLKHVAYRNNSDLPGKTWTYVMRDGNSRIIMGLSSGSKNLDNVQKEKNESESHKSEAVIKKISDRFTSAKIKKPIDVTMIFRSDRASTSDCDIMENNAFHMIGDEDL